VRQAADEAQWTQDQGYPYYQAVMVYFGVLELGTRGEFE